MAKGDGGNTMNKNDWSEEERKAIEAEYAAVLAGELVPFEEVIRAVEEQQRQLDKKKNGE